MCKSAAKNIIKSEIRNPKSEIQNIEDPVKKYVKSKRIETQLLISQG